MATNTLETTIFDKKLNCNVDVEIEYEWTSEPNGKPDPKDPMSEGYDIVPEILDIKILEIEGPIVMGSGDLMDWLQNFESANQEWAKETVEEYQSGIDDDDFDITEED